jgi:hypothetical protein
MTHTEEIALLLALLEQGSFTRKHFYAMAAILHSSGASISLAEQIASSLEHTNARFDRDRFVDKATQ